MKKFLFKLLVYLMLILQIISPTVTVYAQGTEVVSSTQLENITAQDINSAVADADSVTKPDVSVLPDSSITTGEGAGGVSTPGESDGSSQEESLPENDGQASEPPFVSTGPDSNISDVPPISNELVLNGWVDGKYYYINGVPVTGWQEIEGKSYVFAADGIVKIGVAGTGGVEYEGKWYITDDKGAVLKDVIIEKKPGVFIYYGLQGIVELGWIDHGGKRYYQAYDNINGNHLVTGRFVIEDKEYFFDSNGVHLQSFTGWVADKYYLINGVPATGWQDIDGKSYVFAADGVVKIGVVGTGGVEYNGKWYITDDKGAILKDVIIEKKPGVFIYYGLQGTVELGWINHGGAKYYQAFNSANGNHLVTGRIFIEGKEYYFNKNGVCMDSFTGWVDGKYYLINGVPVKGWQDIGGKSYVFDTDGVVKIGVVGTGGVEYNGKWYITDASGAILKDVIIEKKPGVFIYYGNQGTVELGWVNHGGKRYYQAFDNISGNHLVTGRFVIGGTPYFFSSTGVLLENFTGWVDGKYYLVNGVSVTGWQDIGGKSYVFAADGIVKIGVAGTGGVEYNGKWYITDASGAVLKDVIIEKKPGVFIYYGNQGTVELGWVNHGGNKYYQAYNSSKGNHLVMGRFVIEGKVYFFNSKGVLLENYNGWIEDKYYLINGVPVTGWKDIDGKSYIFDSDGMVNIGVPGSGGVEYNGRWFITDEKGAVLKDVIIEKKPGLYIYYDNNGYVGSGWINHKGNTYYQAYNSTNGSYLVSGGFRIEGKLYLFETNRTLTRVTNGWINDKYFIENGVPVTGWKDVNGKSYIFDAELGFKQTGTVLYNNAWYYANDKGEIQKDAFIQKSNGKVIYYGYDGKVASGWFTRGSNTYYQAYDDTYGNYVVSGFFNIGNKLFYFGSDYILFKPQADSICKIEGKEYFVVTSGQICVDPSITSVTTNYNPTSKTFTLTINVNRFDIPLHPNGSYSIDGGLTWRASNVFTVYAEPGTQIPAGKIRFRNVYGLFCIYDKVLTLTPQTNKGIDVSAFQGNIDFNQVRDSGVGFVIVRALYWPKGGTYYKIDPYFERNVRNAKAAGLQVGVYLYSYAFNPSEMEEEINFFLRSNELRSVLNSGIKFDYPVFIDFEDKLLIEKGGSRDNRTATLRHGMNLLRNAGYYTGFYTYENFADNYIDARGLINQGYDFWVANFNGSTSYQNVAGMWQYSSKGSVPGIAGNVDMNTAYKNYPSIINPGGGGAPITPTQDKLTVHDLNTDRIVTDTVESILAQIVYNEVGSGLGLSGGDALKLYQAQAVAAQSWILFQYNDNVEAPKVGLKPVPPNKQIIFDAVSSVKNNIILYNGKPACTMYGASSHTVTNSSADMGWGSLPYLSNVNSPNESWGASAYIGRTTTIDTARMRTNIEKILGPNRTSNTPYSQWLTNPVYNSYGYCTQITICGTLVSGGLFFDNCYGLYSPNFQITNVDTNNGAWTFKTNGNGHCVGFSQWGAAGMIAANSNTTWRSVLQHYFPGTTIY